MNLGFHYHFPFQLNESGKISTVGYLGVFVDELSENFDHLTIYAYKPLPSEKYMIDYEIKSKKVELISLGIHDSVPKRLYRFLTEWNNLKKSFEENDAFLIRAPTPLLPFLFFANRDKPFFQYLVGSYLAANKTYTNKSIKTQMIKIFNWVIENSQYYIAKRKTTIVNSEKLRLEYSKMSKNTHLVLTTTLSKTSFLLREKDISLPVKILYTGRFTPSKGISEILEACKLLNKEGYSCELHLAGMIEKTNEDYIVDLIKKSKSQGFDSIYNHGYKAAGDKLWSLYRKADIYITAPKNDAEGFPRVIWESMANSCPVIATKAGSIPHFLTHNYNALLLNECEPLEIKNAFLKYITDDKFRNMIIRNGYALASENTQEKRCFELSEIIKKESSFYC